MLRRWRCFAALWAAGFLYTAVSTGSGPFHWIGVSNMDVFNRHSLRAAEWRVVYTRGGTLLPFMNYAGDNLAWMDDENFKYRTYLGIAYGLEKGSTQDFAQGFRRLSQMLLRPALYDFCQRRTADVPYTIDLKHSSQAHVSYRLTWPAGPEARKRCPASWRKFFFRAPREVPGELLEAEQSFGLTPAGKLLRE